MPVLHQCAGGSISVFDLLQGNIREITPRDICIWSAGRQKLSGGFSHEESVDLTADLWMNVRVNGSNVMFSTRTTILLLSELLWDISCLYEVSVWIITYLILSRNCKTSCKWNFQCVFVWGRRILRERWVFVPRFLVGIICGNAWDHPLLSASSKYFCRISGIVNRFYS